MNNWFYRVFAVFAFFAELKQSLTWSLFKVHLGASSFLNLPKTFAQTNKCTLDFTLHKTKQRRKR